jgi:adenosine kinase
VFTQGTLPTIVAHPNGTIEECPVVPVDPKDIVDTNGAGDAFVGGFLSQYIQGKSIDECVAAGSWLASIVVKVKGASLPDEKLPYPPSAQ